MIKFLNQEILNNIKISKYNNLYLDINVDDIEGDS
jgi:hypothetical protein